MTDPDIVIYVHWPQQASLLPKTERGAKWIDEEIKSLLRPVTIKAEFVEDMTQSIREAGLEVEVK